MKNNNMETIKIKSYTSIPLERIIEKDGKKYEVINNDEIVEVTLKEVKETKKSTLDNLIKVATKRENEDDHLTEEERQELVSRFINENPDFVSSGNMTEDYIEIIF